MPCEFAAVRADETVVYWECAACDYKVIWLTSRIFDEIPEGDFDVAEQLVEEHESTHLERVTE